MKNIKIALITILAIAFASCSSNPKPASGDDTSTFTNNSRMVTPENSKSTDSTQTADTSMTKP